MTRDIDFGALSTAELLIISRKVLDELRRRNVLRTANAPAGDYAEYLVQKVYGGSLAPNSEKSWDLLSSDGLRIQVKCRVLSSRGRGTMLFSPFRSFDFDVAVFVLLSSEDLSVVSAVEIPAAGVQSNSTYREHVNGYVTRTSIAGLAAGLGGRDVTDQLREAAGTS